MTIKEALDKLGSVYYYCSYSYTENNGLVCIDYSICFDDDDIVDLDTVENFHFTGNFLSVDDNRSLRSLDGMVFDGKMIRAYGTGIDDRSHSYIQDLVRKV